MLPASGPKDVGAGGKRTSADVGTGAGGVFGAGIGAGASTGKSAGVSVGAGAGAGTANGAVSVWEGVATLTATDGVSAGSRGVDSGMK